MSKFRLDYDSNKTIKEEVEAIKDSYLDKSEGQEKLDELRRIDFKVKNIPLIISLAFGIIGTLVFGLGLTFFLEFKSHYVLASFLSLFGIILISLAYPLYNKIYKKLKNKYKARVIELSNTILDEIDN